MSDIFCENIYYLGPDGSNCQSAMLKFLNASGIKTKNQVPLKTIKSVIETIQNDSESICILPIENSLEGIVRETIDNIQKIKNHKIKIQGEISIPIKHLLLSKNKNIKEIKTIISHPQALAQCGNYLYKNFKNAEKKEVSSTSYAAQKVAGSDDITIAAIASETSANIFGLNILSDDINDEKGNTTRFYILSEKQLEKTGMGKTSIILSTKNRPGALCDVLQVLYRHKINLSYIDSRPSRKGLGEYLFCIDMEGYETEENNKSALTELKEYTNFLKIIGSYQIY